MKNNIFYIVYIDNDSKDIIVKKFKHNGINSYKNLFNNKIEYMTELTVSVSIIHSNLQKAIINFAYAIYNHYSYLKDYSDFNERPISKAILQSEKILKKAKEIYPEHMIDFSFYIPSKDYLLWSDANGSKKVDIEKIGIIR